jgi:hypothetical protein
MRNKLSFVVIYSDAKGEEYTLQAIYNEGTENPEFVLLRLDDRLEIVVKNIWLNYQGKICFTRKQTVSYII